MPVHDFQINASVRTLLVRHWLSTSRLTLGTTNGVVYVSGPFVPAAAPRAGEAATLLGTLERDMRSVPGVRDVVLTVPGWEKRGETWVRTPSAS